MLRRLREAVPDAFWTLETKRFTDRWHRARLLRPRSALDPLLTDARRGRARRRVARPTLPGITTDPVPADPLAPERLGFYVPYHCVPATDAGIYLMLDGIRGVANLLVAYDGALTPGDALFAAQLFAFHRFEHACRVEGFAMRLEALLREPVYKTFFALTRNALRATFTGQASAIAARTAARAFGNDRAKESIVGYALDRYLVEHGGPDVADLRTPVASRQAQYRMMEELRSTILGSEDRTSEWIWHPVANLFAPVPGVHAFAVEPRG
ncbi:MAG: hypothetical protein ACYC7A_18195 [Thermoanaerobaculia bacterium]